MKKVVYIDEVEIKNKKVLLRTDFNVSLNVKNEIADDFRIRQTIPTIKYLLANNNQIIIISHLGRPKGFFDKRFSLRPVVDDFKKYLPSEEIDLVETVDDLSQNQKKIVFLENIRFFPEEKNYSTVFAKKLASLADVYVNDAFGVCHRLDTSIVGLPKFLLAFGGLLLKKEIEMLETILRRPKRPLVAIIGGAKVSTKIGLLEKLAQIVDYLIIGGGLANTFLCAQKFQVGSSFCDYETIEIARRFLAKQQAKKPIIILPKDVAVAQNKDSSEKKIVKINEVKDLSIFDLGPETLAEIGSVISKAKMIVWNGPVGYFENSLFAEGTDFIYYSITQNHQATSIIGGGDTLAAISKKEYLDKITHISTGGGAMLEYIEKGTLPGIEALKRS